MEIVQLVAEGDEVYFFTVTDGRISAAWGLEDTERRKRQLGLPGGA